MLENFKSDYGIILDTHETFDNRFVLVFRDNAANLSERRAVTDALMYITHNRTIRLVGCDGAFGDIDTSWLGIISDKDMRNKIVDSLFNQMKLTPGEYCHIHAPVPFALFGLEDKELYKRGRKVWNALLPLLDYMHKYGQDGLQKFGKDFSQYELNQQLATWEEFLSIDKERGLVIVKKLIKKMSDMDINESALICQGNLPDYASNFLNNLGISYARVKPRSSSEDNWVPVNTWLKEQLEMKEG